MWRLLGAHVIYSTANEIQKTTRRSSLEYQSTICTKLNNKLQETEEIVRVKHHVILRVELRLWQTL